MELQVLEADTGKLFEKLWGPYNEELFDKSVELFEKRLRIHGFDVSWFEGKSCLDAGCGGGRSSVAMARLGARHVVGMDIGREGLDDARRRAASRGLSQVEFRHGSVLDIPFEDESFDLVWCAGVIMHTADDERALDEVCRVLKKGGSLYLLVYATEGVRWPLINVLRPLAAQIGQPAIERATELVKLPANKVRTFLDDLFVPKFDFYTWQRLERLLHARGLTSLDRWGVEERLDHEASLESYRKDLAAIKALFAAGDCAEFGANRALFRCAAQLIDTTVDAISWFEHHVDIGDLSTTQAMDLVIGQGHHRVFAVKG